MDELCSQHRAFVLVSGVVLGHVGCQGRPDLAGWFYSGVGLGIAVSGLVVLALDRLAWGGAGVWRANWLGIAALAAGFVALCWMWLPRMAESRAVEPAMPRRETPNPATASVVLLIGSAYFLEGARYSVTGTFLVAIVADVPRLGALGTGAWILVGLAAAPSTVLWTSVAVRLGHVPTLVVAYATQALGVAAPALSLSGWVAIGSAILFGGTFMGITALTIDYARRVSPREAHRMIGMLTAVFGLGQVVGPVGAAAIADRRASAPGCRRSCPRQRDPHHGRRRGRACRAWYGRIRLME